MNWGYLFIAIALAAGATKGFCGKKTSGFVEETKDAMFVNFIRMMFCIFIGFAMLAVQGSLNLLAIDAKTLAITALSGISTSFFVVSWLLAVKRGAYMTVEIFLMLSVVLTLIMSFFTFGEPIELTQWIGLAVLICAVYIMCSYNNSLKGKMTVGTFILLVFCGCMNAFSSFSQKLFVKNGGENVAVFNFYTYLFSASVLLICYFVLKSKSKDADGIFHAGILKNIFGYVLIMASCLFINSYFMTLAASKLDASMLYPLSQGCSLVLSTLMAAVFFKEKLNIKAIAGIVLSFIALIIINVL